MKLSESNYKPLLVFVHLGINPAPTLIQNANLAQRNLPDSELVLITDYPENWSEFPGNVIIYNEELHREKVIIWLVKKYPEFRQIGNGYWIFTLERIFALARIFSEYDLDRCILHIESDVAIFIDEDILKKMIETIPDAAVPRYSDNEGVASVIFSPNGFLLLQSLQKLSELIFDNSSWITDMELLGLALNSGALKELPTFPGQLPELCHEVNGQKYEILFDALAIGQYFGGLDPVHTGGRAISGHISPKLPFEIHNYIWHVSNKNEKLKISLSSIKNNISLANLHMHSKRTFDDASESFVWNQLASEANGLTSRLVGDFVEDVIHTSPVSTLNRLRLLRRRGFRYLLKKLLSKR